MDHMIHFLDSPAVSRFFFVVFQDTHLTFGKISFETVFFLSPGDFFFSRTFSYNDKEAVTLTKVVVTGTREVSSM